MRLEYDDTAIQKVLINLDKLKIEGIDNAKRLVIIESILQSPVRKVEEGINEEHS